LSLNSGDGEAVKRGVMGETASVKKVKVAEEKVPAA
jgi:hypothetical protein